ncbi:hypothetical protein OPV22_028615 [Ensete ventricosum]|uniref:DNA replication checkpoint mediator MRC1 domain-containing protein n=1 Tax=Ensete ventricosum TaxID=4639 RepID=A0AAV8Q6X0_ENSVE|nr:hypothetical protein OPV22_028615 [Ensete ventricosum]
MEGSFDDDDLPLPRSQSVSPVSKPKLRRLKKADHSGPRDIPTADPVLSPSRVHPVAAPTMAATPASEESVPESHVMEPEMGQEPVLDPLFPDPARCEPNYMEIEREKQGFDWGGENGSAGVQEAKDVKSAKKRLNSEKEGETTRKYKKNKSGDKPKESAREKRRLEKEREAELVRVHAESQRLLRETSNVSFTPSPIVRIPIPPLLEKIRRRKRELLEMYGYFNHPESTNDSTSNKVDICHDFDLTGPENGRGDDEHLEENKFPHDRSLDGGEIGSIPTDCENDLPNQATNPNSEDANQTLNIVKEVLSNDSDQSGEHNQLVYNANDTLKDTLSSLPTSTPKLVSMDFGHPSSSSPSEDDDNENIGIQPHKVVNMDSCTEHGPVKAFVDDEAEEEDDSDHDLMRFQENEEDDESDDDDVVNDLIATDFKEAPIDHESRNLLHQKWVEQQDTAATDNFLQRLRCGQKQKEPTFSHEEEENEEFSEKSEEEESYSLPRTNAARKNAKLAKQMIAQMYTDDQDAYVSSDDEEIEQALIRQRILRQNEQSTAISLADDGDSREFFGLIKKVNNASEPKMREKTFTCDFDRLLTRGSSNSSSKASFLGRAKGSSIPYSHKQGSTTARAFIFGRDDSNSRSCLTAPENHQNVDEMEKQHRKPSSAKFNGSQVKSTCTSKKAEASKSSGYLFVSLNWESKVATREV